MAWALLAILVVGLLTGTQMPNAWRNEAVQAMHAPGVISSVAHFVIFAAMAAVLAVRPLAWPFGRIVLASLALALLSEGLQFFAIDRHPRGIDVGIDMAGALLGIALVALLVFVRRAMTFVRSR